MALSARASELAKPDPRYFFWQVLQNIWHPEANPDGYVSLGVAENVLMHHALSERIHRAISLGSDDLTYGDGKKRLRAALARFLTRHLHPAVAVQPSHLTVSNGCSSALEHMAWALGDPGDVFLLGKPYYGTFVPDLTLRMGTQLAMVDFGGVDPLSLDGVRRYDLAVRSAHAQGKRVAGLILAHPHNPLGRCYPRPVLLALMALCARYRINLVSDEIYALSTFANTVDRGADVADSTAPFESVLSLPTDGVIDPALVHVIWGISKDFGANGLRLGAIVSQRNPALHQALVPPSLYSSSSSITDQVMTAIFHDDAWVDGYLEKNRQRLAESHAHVVRWARAHGIEYLPGVNAAFFLWVNLGAAYGGGAGAADVEDVDQVVTDALLAQKVFLASGLHFGSEQAGWFRIVFTHARDHLDEGLRRIVAALNLTSERGVQGRR
ncbi:uncharacterized protein UV8b_04755 [Ustilaginoidea virens]|uniref:Aminotransferase class I/classII large domain-containing protein n=1 Tax=Ustilaginoidea virens TaxID=1159556 RepID=A0A063BTQ5_USTVR|nr:uncharacterized protein UV8b_04755 [Ustilaginoidea virens]QUC20514.1 hypothetical protein UV8b_04755 [Ustilaginoidea virens]GAO15583.1 hypothetical protein UVI_02050160 [Ustilaginoidea virens]